MPPSFTDPGRTWKLNKWPNRLSNSLCNCFLYTKDNLLYGLYLNCFSFIPIHIYWHYLSHLRWQRAFIYRRKQAKDNLIKKIRTETVLLREKDNRHANTDSYLWADIDCWQRFNNTLNTKKTGSKNSWSSLLKNTTDSHN